MPRKKRRNNRVKTNSSLLNGKIAVSWKNFAIFLVLFVISFFLYEIIPETSTFLVNLFGILSIIFGFLSIALLIVLAVFLILKSGTK